jgi:hypothetical protein
MKEAETERIAVFQPPHAAQEGLHRLDVLAAGDGSVGATLVRGPVAAAQVDGAGDRSTSGDGPAPPVQVVALPPAARLVARRVCQVAFAGMLPSEQTRVEVHAWVERLGELISPMTAGQVLIEVVDRGRKERQYRVRMDLTMPGGVVVVDHDHPNNRPHEDVYVAIRNGFRAARRQLEIYREGPV